MNMRKYTATVAQVLDLAPNQLDWVCRHLGHNQTVHLEHYRQTSPFLERVEIGKVLMLQDLNLQTKFVGKKLSEVQFADLLAEADKDVSYFQEDSLQVHSAENAVGTNDGKEDENAPVDMDVDVVDDMDEDVYIARKSDDEDMDQDESDAEYAWKEKLKKKGKGKPKVKPNRVKWTATEVDELRRYLKSAFEMGKTPCRKACEKAIKLSKKNGGELQRRDYRKIVKKVSNMLSNERRREALSDSDSE